MQNPYVQALDFLVDAGVTVALQDASNDRFAVANAPVIPARAGISPEINKIPDQIRDDALKPPVLQPHIDTIKQAEELAGNSKTLDDLKAAIQNFDGLSVKKTATQIVFADGHPQAQVMVIGEAPGADEDRQGLPFVGVSGQLLDKIFSCIDLNRQAIEPEKSIYISNILNWRPPGNRTPTKEEMDIAAPFIKRHIELVKPKFLVLCGAVAAQTLLNSTQSISRLRGEVHQYSEDIQAIATYHPSYLLRTPLQKKKVWDDMLMLQEVLDA